jgi:hypothetical protein
MALSITEVNQKHSNTWNRCNTDAKSYFFRNQFTSKFGGNFVKENKYWIWEETKIQEPVKLIVPTPEPTPKEPKRIVILEDSEGARYEVTNVKAFCREKDLSPSSISDLISGRRKTHKGFKYIETIEPTE